MNFRKNSLLIIGCSCAFLLLIAAVFFLAKTRSSYTANLAELKRAQTRLTQLNTRNPFPSEENIAMARENLSVLKTRYESLQASLVDRQIARETVESAGFAPLLEGSVKRVMAKAADAGVKVFVDGFSLGFKDYAAGKLPPADPDIMERLVLQLKTSEDLCMRLIASKVQSIDGITRNIFEDQIKVEVQEPDDRRSRSRRSSRQEPQVVKTETILGLPAVESNKLYATERFIVEFTGWESSIWEAINQLVRSDVTYVISDLAFENTQMNVGQKVDMLALLNELSSTTRAQTPAMRTPAPAVGRAPALDSIPHDDRIVGGQEPIRVRLTVDLYQFAELTDGEAE